MIFRNETDGVHLDRFDGVLQFLELAASSFKGGYIFFEDELPFQDSIATSD
jgi:hypothetical protein